MPRAIHEFFLEFPRCHAEEHGCALHVGIVYVYEPLLFTARRTAGLAFKAQLVALYHTRQEFSCTIGCPALHEYAF